VEEEEEAEEEEDCKPPPLMRAHASATPRLTPFFRLATNATFPGRKLLLVTA
jgi:hypothetical protein